MTTPRTQAGQRMYSAVIDRADFMRHDPANGLPLGLSYILAIEAEARGLEHDRLSHVAWAQPVIEAEALPSVERLAAALKVWWYADRPLASLFGPSEDLFRKDAEIILAALRDKP